MTNTTTTKRKGHTPKAGHHWKKSFVPGEIRRWAMEQSHQTKIETWKVGGGKPQK